jgi:hypothetical protein
MGNRAARWPSSSPSSSLSLSSARRAGSKPESGTSQVVPHTSFLALVRARVPVRDVQQVTNVFCLQECSVVWATYITDGMDNECWRVHTHESLLIAWRSDSLERIDNAWHKLFPPDASLYRNWRGYMRVRMGFLGWSTAASPVREFQSSGTGPARADVVWIAFHTDCFGT